MISVYLIGMKEVVVRIDVVIIGIVKDMNWGRSWGVNGIGDFFIMIEIGVDVVIEMIIFLV